MTIREFLRSRSIDHESLLHRPAPSASHRAQSVHISGDQVAKAVLLRTGSEYILAVLPATYRVDLEKLSIILSVAGIGLATEEEVQAIFYDCELGAMPPFGSVYGLRTYVDDSLAECTEIVIDGNLRHEGLELAFHDFETIETPVHEHFAQPIGKRRRRNPKRRAS